MPAKTTIPRAELHAHLGSSVDPAILSDIAHLPGIRLTSKNYWNFEDMITMSGNERNRNLDELHNNYFYWTELIQSSPEAILESIKSVFGGGYRKCNIVHQELRFNPMFRNRGGERDLDHIIMAGIWGLDQAKLEYPMVKGGLILMVERTQPLRLGKIIFSKAIKYKNRGVIGVNDQGLMRELVKNDITLETCPTSNLRNSIAKNVRELKNIYKTLLKNKVKFTINTDGPEMYRTNIHKEQEFLKKSGILTATQIAQCTKWAFAASFIK